jgi:hypothetical protein
MLSKRNMALMIIALVIGSAMAILKPFPAGDQNSLFNWLLVFVLLVMGVALSIHGIIKRSAVELVCGIAFTTLVPLLLQKIGQLELPYATLFLAGYMILMSISATVHFLRSKMAQVSALWCDVTVMYCCAVAIYVIYTLYSEIFAVAFAVVGIIVPSIFYFLNRNGLSYEALRWGIKL